MTQVYLRSGKTFTPEDSTSLNINETLPPGTYSVGVSPRGFYLEAIDNFELPLKLYGNVIDLSKRILSTFNDRPSGTGVLLSGNKGSGKTMLSKRIALDGIEAGMICIVVNQALRGESFNRFIQGIDQPAVILFDEFEKVYETDEQRELLTLFDGTYSSKKLFVMTCNERHRIDSYMQNRPGRIFYSLDFVGLSKQFIIDYCNDNLKDLSKINGILNVSTFFSEFSFDMLKALVEEMNRYNESATESMQILNMKPQYDSYHEYDVTLLENGHDAAPAGSSFSVYPSSINRNPMHHDGTFFNLVDDRAEDDDDYVPSRTFRFNVNNLVSIDQDGQKMLFDLGDDMQICFTRRVKEKSFINYDLF